MYINKYIILFVIIFFVFNACNERKAFESSESIINYNYKYLDGNIRSFDIINDTLFVASEDYGIVIYKIINDEGDIYLDSLSSSNLIEIPVSLDIAKESRSLIVLDDYNHTYIGKLDFFDTNSAISGITCDDYQRESAFIDHADKPIELITPFRHKSTQNEVDPLAWNTSFLHRIKFLEETYDYDIYSADCSDTLYKYLNYNIEDVYYNNEKLYLVNPQDTINSIKILRHNLLEDDFTVYDSIAFSSTPLTVKSNNDYIFVGLDDDEGCYIKLLDSNDSNHSNFSIALGYDIQDIQLSDNYMVLSAGYSGLLVYKWINATPELFFILGGGGLYSYKAIMYDDFNIIAGTKSGLHIYKIER